MVNVPSVPVFSVPVLSPVFSLKMTTAPKGPAGTRQWSANTKVA